MRTGSRGITGVARKLLSAACIVALAAACSSADNPGAPDDAPDLSEHRFTVGSAENRVDYVARGGVLYTATGEVVLRRAEMPEGSFDRFVTAALRMHALRTESHGALSRSGLTDARIKLTCAQIDERYESAQDATDAAYRDYITFSQTASPFALLIDLQAYEDRYHDAIATEEMWHEAGHAAGCYD